jgi:4-hydroxy-tetrahydrodipicolinate synthase
MEILRERPNGFRVLSGDDSFTFPMIALGGEGLISVASNEAPALMSQMVNFALEGKWEEARALHYRLLPLMEVNFTESSPGPVKAALAMMGLIEESYRLPLVPIADQSKAKVRAVINELGLLRETSHAAA